MKNFSISVLLLFLLQLLFFSLLLDSFRLILLSPEKTADIVYARTMIFAALGVDSLFYVWLCWSLRRFICKVNFFSNNWLVWAVLGGFILQLSAIYLLPLQTIFRTIPLGISDRIIILISGVIEILVIEATKAMFIGKRR